MHILKQWFCSHTHTENDLITQNGTDKEWKRTMSTEVLIIITSMVESISKEIAVYGWLRICQCVLYWCERIASIVLDIEKTNIRLGASPMSRFMQKPVEIICTVLYSHLHSMMKPYIANRLWFKEWRNRRSDSMIHLLICDLDYAWNETTFINFEVKLKENRSLSDDKIRWLATSITQYAKVSRQGHLSTLPVALPKIFGYA